MDYSVVFFFCTFFMQHNLVDNWSNEKYPSLCEQFSWYQSPGAVEYTNSPPPQWVSCYDTKQSDGKVPVMLGLWEMWSTPSLPLLPAPLWPGMGAPDRALCMGWIELNCILILN